MPCSGHDDADEIGIDRKTGLNELDPIHSGHHQIGQQQIEFPLPEHHQGLGAGQESHGFVSLVGQHLAQGGHQFDLIIDDHDAADFVID